MLVGFGMTQETPRHYHVAREAKGWRVIRIDQPCHIGNVDTRKEGLIIARILAGRNGKVTTGKYPA